MKKSIRKRLILSFILFTVAPLLLVGGTLSWLSYSTMEKVNLKMQGEMGQGVFNKVTAFFEEIESELNLAGRLNVLLKDNQKEQFDSLKLLMGKYVYDRLTLLDQNGKTLAYLSRLAVSASDKGDYAETEEFKSVKASGEVYYSAVRFDQTTGEPLITIAVPVIDLRLGIPEGVLVSEVRLKKIWDLISEIKLNPGQDIYIIDEKGKLIAHRNPSLVLKGDTYKIPAVDGVQTGLTGGKAVVAVHRANLGKEIFNIVSEQTTVEAFKLAINMVRITAILIVLALSAAGILGLILVRQIIRPIQDMAETAKVVSSGDLTQQVKIIRKDELGILAGAFNSMTLQLKTLIDGLEQKIADRTAQLKDAQDELIRKERLAALGKLTATIAHEIRNPLATVNTSIFSIGAAMEKNETERIKRTLVLAERNIRRCDNIITELLDYTRKLEIRPYKVNIDNWINGILDEQPFPEKIECLRNLNCHVEAKIDVEHLRRAVINLLTNATHALAEENSPGKKMTVETAISGDNIEIRIIDTGPGIPEDLQQKIFEPLFSTKGFGVGLGLSIVKDIMEKHNGGVEIKSKTGEGTQAILWFPLSA
jgi:signal transduction histidine kinase